MSEAEVPRRDAGTPAVLAALAVGALAGGLGATLWQHGPEPEATAAIEVPREYTTTELQIACLPLMRQTATTLEQAQTRVSALEVRIRDKEAEIARLEDEIDDHGQPLSDVGPRLDAARAQLTSLEEQLAAAQAEREELLRDLQEARAQIASNQLQLAASRAELVETREAKLDEQWLGFVKDAQLQICDVGSAYAVETCRAEVAASLEGHKRRYKECVRSSQAPPQILHATRRDEVLPDIAVWLGGTERPLVGWYVLFCDPDLPERGQRGVTERGEIPFEN
jgi:hypothetical protein